MNHHCSGIRRNLLFLLNIERSNFSRGDQARKMSCEKCGKASIEMNETIYCTGCISPVEVCICLLEEGGFGPEESPSRALGGASTGVRV